MEQITLKPFEKSWIKAMGLNGYISKMKSNYHYWTHYNFYSEKQRIALLSQVERMEAYRKQIKKEK